MKKHSLRKAHVAGREMWLTEASLNGRFDNDRWEIENRWYSFPENVGDSGVIVEVGARCGVQTVYLAKRYPDARIIAIEAIGEQFDQLEANVAANGLANVVCINAGIVRGISAEASVVTERNGPHAVLRRVPSARLSEILATHGVDRVSLLKISGRGVATDLLADFPAGSVGHVTGVIDDAEMWLPTLRRRLSEVSGTFDVIIDGLFEPGRMTGTSAEASVPDLTVVIPVYNVEQYIETCLLSIVANSDIRLEVLAVNDGSPDKSGEIIERFSKIHPEVKHVVKPNGGCASARNYGLKLATGRYVTFIDSDDWVSADGLRRAIRLACLNNPDVVMFGFVKCYEESGARHYIDGCALSPHRDKLIREVSVIREVTLGEPSIWRKIYRRDFLESRNIEFELGFRRFDDLPFNFKVFTEAKSLRILPEAHYFYRLGREGQDVAISDKRLQIHVDIMKYLHSYACASEDKDAVFRFIILFIATHNWGWHQSDAEFKDEYLALCKKQYDDLKIAGLCDEARITAFSKPVAAFLQTLKA